MNFEELRLGNKINSPNGIIDIDMIQYDRCGYKYEVFFFDEIEPIPLTEEWLLKFGFEKHHADYFNDVIMLKLIKSSTNEYEIYFYPPCLGSATTGRFKRIYFIHQLQNLYFALTGDELTINNQP